MICSRISSMVEECALHREEARQQLLVELVDVNAMRRPVLLELVVQ